MSIKKEEGEGEMEEERKIRAWGLGSCEGKWEAVGCKLVMWQVERKSDRQHGRQRILPTPLGGQGDVVYIL